MNTVNPGAPASVADQVYQYVKSRILDHTLEGGELISEGDVATTLQVSRTPVREGFIRLQTEGWMTLYPKRGALIREIGPHEVRDVVQARIMVESQAVRAIIEAGDHLQVAEELEAILEHQETARTVGDHDEFVDLDAQFHQRAVVSGGNELITGFYLSLADRQRRMSARSLWKSDRSTERVLNDHRELLRLVREADAIGFTDALSGHLTSVHHRLLA